MLEKEQPVKPKIALSTASCLPFSIIDSISKSEKLADEIGATEGLEVLPTASIIFELWLHKQLQVSNPNKITSIHTGWNTDRRRDKPLSFDPGIITKTICKLLPSANKSDEVLKELTDKYPKARTVFHWEEDTSGYKNPTLEVHELVGKKTKKEKPWTVEQILKWVNDDPTKNRKLALDISIRKLHEYCKTQGILENDTLGIMKVMDDLLPHAGIIHFQAAQESEIDAIWNNDMNSQLAKLTRKSKEKAPNASYVIELNMIQIMKKYKFKWKEFYKRAVEFVKKA